MAGEQVNENFLFMQTNWINKPSYISRKPAIAYYHVLPKSVVGVNTAESLRMEISNRISKFDFISLAEDVSPFLINPADIQRVENFRDFWGQVELQ